MPERPQKSHGDQSRLWRRREKNRQIGEVVIAVEEGKGGKARYRSENSKVEEEEEEGEKRKRKTPSVPRLIKSFPQNSSRGSLID